MYILSLDSSLFLWFNGMHTPWLDSTMWHYTQSSTWVALYIAIVLYLFGRFGWKAIWIVMAIGAAVGLSDFIASGIFKPLTERLRPSHEPMLEGLVHIVNGYRGGHYGFMSSHASNTFAVACSVGLLVRRRHLSILLFTWATLNAYSRIYLGVHYPGDIVCGALVGCLMAWVCGFALRKTVGTIPERIPYSTTTYKKWLELIIPTTFSIIVLVCCLA